MIRESFIVTCCVVACVLTAACPPVYSATTVRVDPQFIVEQNLDVQHRLAQSAGVAELLQAAGTPADEGKLVEPARTTAVTGLIVVHLEKARRLARSNRNDQSLKRLAAVEAQYKEIVDRAASGQGVQRGQLSRLYRDVRQVRRELFLAQLPESFDKIIFVHRKPHTAGGRYFTTHNHFEPGGHNVCVYSCSDGVRTELLDVPGTTAIRDGDLSFDGKRFVFAAKSSTPESFRGLPGPAGKWNIFEVSTESDRAGNYALKRLTQIDTYDLEPTYLLDGRILFGSLRSGCASCCTGDTAYNFYVMDGDGSNVRRFTSNYLYDVTPSVMHDGRIVFLRWEHEDKPGNHINALWTVRQDGTGVAGYFGTHTMGCALEPKSIPGTEEVVCVDTGTHGHWHVPAAGNLGIVDVRRDRNKFTHVIPTPLPFKERWGFKTPWPITEDLFLATYGNPKAGYGVYVVDREGTMELLYKDPAGMGAFNAVALQRRHRPQTAVTTEASDGDRSGWATLTLQNVYMGLEGVEPGTVKSLRIVEVTDKPMVRNGNSGFADQTIAVSYVYRMVRRVVGTVPVYADGSAHFKVPGGASVYFQALDADGLLVQTMRDSTDFQAGERASCVGCHEHRSTAPAQGSTLPVAFARPADVPQPLAGGRRGVSFPRDIQPILDRRCVKCHDVSDPKGGAVLCGDLTRTFNVSYETLVDQNRRQGHSLHTGPTAAVAPVINYIPGAIPPRSTGSATAPLMRKYAIATHHDVKLPAEESRMLAAWVDLNLPYYDDWLTKRYDGGRNIELGKQARDAIGDVLARRCSACHDAGRRKQMITLGVMCNVSRPKLSRILAAPTPNGQCGKASPQRRPPFADATEADYQKILKALESLDVYGPPYKPLDVVSAGE